LILGNRAHLLLVARRKREWAIIGADRRPVDEFLGKGEAFVDPGLRVRDGGRIRVGFVKLARGLDGGRRTCARA